MVHSNHPYKRRSTALKLTTLIIPTPQNFSFWHTVNSHGWCSLQPFSVDKERLSLERIFTLAEGSLASCHITAPQGTSLHVAVSSSEKLSNIQHLDLKRQIGSCLRLTENFSDFYREVGRHARYRWIAGKKAGRLLRAPTVFEDVIKMICTTNCSWSLTEIMVENLVEKLGRPFDDSHKSFPSPKALAGVTEQFLRKKIRAGYRSPFILEFAENVAAEKIEVESWRSLEIPADILLKELRSIKGIGEYAAGNLMKLLGRYDYLGLDSWVRSKYYELYHKGRKVSDQTIERNYQPYGKWRGLIFWMEMTKQWYDHKFPF
jgi:3-methyladenine DNA glycosylase/8-oxoguanine DNA glycosylase